MRVLILLLAAAMAMGAETTTPPAAVYEGSIFYADDNQSQLTGLLKKAGYSDTCVANALAFCANGETCPLKAFVEEARVTLESMRIMVQEVRKAMQSEVPQVVQEEVPQVVPKVEKTSDGGVLSVLQGTESKQESRPRHCQDLREDGDSGRGVRHVYPYPGRPSQRVVVLCDHTVDGGGWTVFQRRDKDSFRQDFNRTWVEYQKGFGDLENEFWLGLDLLHAMTSSSLQHLRIDLHDYEGEHRWAKYDLFHVGDADTKYGLTVSRYSGDAGNSMREHDGQMFSTFDRDNDSISTYLCSREVRGGWWFKDCHHSNLNGYQHQGPHESSLDGINWSQWKGHHNWLLKRNQYSLRETAMMLRPAS